MDINLIQLLMFVTALVVLKFHYYDEKYIYIFLVPFQSLALASIPQVTSFVFPFQVLLIITLILNYKQLNKITGIAYIVMLIPFILSIAYNIWYFVPVQVMEYEVSLRGSGGKSVSERISLSRTNLTQLVYVIFVFASCWLMSSLQLDQTRLKRIIDISIWCVVVVALFQLVTYYTKQVHLYENLFYPIAKNQISHHVQTMFISWKRINASFIEPSYFGFYATFTLSFYYLQFGVKATLKSWPIIALFIMAMLSTSTTFYLGILCILIVIGFFDVNLPLQKKLIILFAVSIVVYFGFGGAINDYLFQKAGSTRVRHMVSWNIPWEIIKSSPFFGAAYGTTRSYYIYTQLMAAIGLVGIIIFIYGFSKLLQTRNAKLFVLIVLMTGLGNFEFTRPEMWMYLGLLVNPSLLSRYIE